jgi:hypothetical protein
LDTPQKDVEVQITDIADDNRSFADIADHEDAYYIEELAQKGIISTKNAKFYPDNFIRLNELAKMVVNGYRYRV